jgi:membrane-bound lytic murein transglycosylase B
MRRGFCSLLVAMFILQINVAVHAAVLNCNPAYQKFINQMVTKEHFDRASLNNLFADFKPDKTVLYKISHPYEKVQWEKYRKTFLTQERINQGVIYWKKHADVLALAEKKYGVPASIIVAIIGIETQYGHIKPTFSVFKTLTTLSFYYPPRECFFQKELREFLLLTRELKINPKTVYGSYAGAIGLPQFMPSNHRLYAVSSKNRSIIDITHDTDDVILSVANYLHAMGWHRDEPIATPAKVYTDNYRYALFDNMEPTMTLADLRAYGVISKRHISKNYPAALLRLDRTDDYEDWIVFHNFYTLLRYNTSYLYAIVVVQLANKTKNIMMN